MKEIKRELNERAKRNIILSIFDCYEKPSKDKVKEYIKCIEFYYSVLKDKIDKYYSKLQVYSYNKYTFTIAFIIDDKLYYITKDKNIYCEMDA